MPSEPNHTYLTALLLGMQILQAFGIFALIFKAGSFFQKVSDIERRVNLIEEKESPETPLAVLGDKVAHLEGALTCPAVKRATTSH